MKHERSTSNFERYQRAVASRLQFVRIFRKKVHRDAQERAESNIFGAKPVQIAVQTLAKRVVILAKNTTNSLNTVSKMFVAISKSRSRLRNITTNTRSTRIRQREHSTKHFLMSLDNFLEKFISRRFFPYKTPPVATACGHSLWKPARRGACGACGHSLWPQAVATAVEVQGWSGG